MPSEIRMLAEPAVLMSAPKMKIRVGISNSPPATPRTLLTRPMPTPITIPATPAPTLRPKGRDPGRVSAGAGHGEREVLVTKKISSLRAPRSNLVDYAPTRREIAASPSGLLAMTGSYLICGTPEPGHQKRPLPKRVLRLSGSPAA